MDSLLASALGHGILQGAVIGQADVGAEGLPEPLAEERGLPCCRCFSKQEGAMERGRELGQVASCSLHSSHSSSSPHLKSPSCSPFCHIKPQPDLGWCFLFLPVLYDLPSWPALVSGPALYPLPFLPASPLTVVLSLPWSLRGHSYWLTSVPTGDRFIWGCEFPGVSLSLFCLHVPGVPLPVQFFPIEWCPLHSNR